MHIARFFQPACDIGHYSFLIVFLEAAVLGAGSWEPLESNFTLGVLGVCSAESLPWGVLLRVIFFFFFNLFGPPTPVCPQAGFFSTVVWV